MSKISFLYLDVGGVAIIDFFSTNKFDDLLAKWGMTPSNHDQVMEVWRSHQSEICLSYPADHISSEFRGLGLEFPVHFSLTKAFVDAFDANTSIWQPVRQAKSHGIKLGLLTNMYQGMLELIANRQLLDLSLFEVVIDSSICGLQKPNPAIYELAEQKACCPSNEILFVDNTLANIEVAKKRGWQTVLYDPTHEQESTAQLALYLENSSTL